MNFIGCDSAWSVGASGELICSGTMTSYTTEELGSLTNPGSLSIEDAQELSGYALELFVAVFCFLVIKKVL